MTHQVHPYSHRLGILRDWKSRWFGGSSKQYREFMKADIMTREYLTKRLRGFHIAEVIIERKAGVFRIAKESYRASEKRSHRYRIELFKEWKGSPY